MSDRIADHARGPDRAARRRRHDLRRARVGVRRGVRRTAELLRRPRRGGGAAVETAYALLRPAAPVTAASRPARSARAAVRPEFVEIVRSSAAERDANQRVQRPHHRRLAPRRDDAVPRAARRATRASSCAARRRMPRALAVGDDGRGARGGRRRAGVPAPTTPPSAGGYVAAPRRALIRRTTEHDLTTPRRTRCTESRHPRPQYLAMSTSAAAVSGKRAARVDGFLGLRRSRRGGGTAFLAACSPGGGASPAPQATGGTLESSLSIYTWGDYDAPDVLEGFTASLGPTITARLVRSNEELIAKLVAAKGTGGYDIVVPTGVFIPQMIENGLLTQAQQGPHPEPRRTWTPRTSAAAGTRRTSTRSARRGARRASSTTRPSSRAS